ncbi:MAG: hypothetical protein ACLFV2_11035 [Desulfurivibrionaceae bacterium]
MKKNCTVEAGYKAVRFRDIKALYLDKSGSGFQEYKILRMSVSHLDWQGYEESAGQLPEKRSFPFQVILVAGKDNLTLWSGGELLAIYPSFLKNSGRSAGEKPEPLRAQAADSLSEKSGLKQGGIAREIEAQDFRSVATLEKAVYNVGVTRTQESESPYLLYLADRSVYARSLQDGEEHRYSYQGFGEVINLSVADYQDELLIAVAEGNSLSGQGRTHILALPLTSLLLPD